MKNPNVQVSLSKRGKGTTFYVYFLANIDGIFIFHPTLLLPSFTAYAKGVGRTRHVLVATIPCQVTNQHGRSLHW
jgi:hypothetical protein